MAPAASPSPMVPAVRVIFSSSTDPLKARSTAIPTTAAGYVAAMVIPARRPRYALAAPRITVRSRPRNKARAVSSRICIFSGTNGRNGRCGFTVHQYSNRGCSRGKRGCVSRLLRVQPEEIRAEEIAGLQHHLQIVTGHAEGDLDGDLLDSRR